ncbi:hypothetical protein Poly30_48130 [Planctomycetes bacterium Poly30]|uniref:Uncharacterized protein n=1 Tax=Saltatorellus ferox TaxID=2528018 RepID=A0A518EYT9_9BACT|nr:hypothetical protein Poly30_48130 [Planctomycetes bacterium Poly30]
MRLSGGISYGSVPIRALHGHRERSYRIEELLRSHGTGTFHGKKDRRSLLVVSSRSAEGEEENQERRETSGDSRDKADEQKRKQGASC